MSWAGHQIKPTPVGDQLMPHNVWISFLSFTLLAGSSITRRTSSSMRAKDAASYRRKSSGPACEKWMAQSPAISATVSYTHLTLPTKA